ncbi:MAG: phosphopantetheine-binding protein [Rhodobacterales bacterium]|nr:MAG: phosphopantetheine-binding protein [Rhodobacterales bacterium]
MSETIRDRVIAIIAEQAVLEPGDVRIEEAFDISVPFNANDPSESDFDISSVAAIITAVEGLVADQTSGQGAGTGA